MATVPFVYRFYPMVREARARVGDGVGPVRLVHGTYLQDWLSNEPDDNWRVDDALSGRSRAFADIGSHWCDLVEFVTGDRLGGRLRRAGHGHPRAAAGASGRMPSSPTETTLGELRAVTTEDVALVMFRTIGGVSGSVVISQVSSGRKNQMAFEIAGAEATLAFDQEQPESLWVGGGAARRSWCEIRRISTLRPRAYAVVPPGHPQGYQDAFDAFVADTYRAIAAGDADAVDGLPTFADGARAAQHHRRRAAVGGEPIGGRTSSRTPSSRRWRHEPRFPHGLPAQAEPGRDLRVGRGGGLRGARGGGLAATSVTGRSRPPTSPSTGSARTTPRRLGPCSTPTA